MVEVGANIGMHAVPIAKAIASGRLICFEPQRVIFQQLCCNLSLNNLTNVEPIFAGGSAVLSAKLRTACTTRNGIMAVFAEQRI